MSRRAAAIPLLNHEHSASAPAPFVLHPPRAATRLRRPSLTLSECLDAVYHQRWWIAAGVIVALAAAWVLSSLLPKSYEAIATIEVTGMSPADAVRAWRAGSGPQADGEFHLPEPDRRALRIDELPDAPIVRIA